jgi:hypothetical protein
VPAIYHPRRLNKTAVWRRSLEKDSAAARHTAGYTGELHPGLHLTAIDGASVAGRSNAGVLAMFRQAGRPVTLHFSDRPAETVAAAGEQPRQCTNSATADASSSPAAAGAAQHAAAAAAAGRVAEPEPNGFFIEAPCLVNGEHGASLRQPFGSPPAPALHARSAAAANEQPHHRSPRPARAVAKVSGPLRPFWRPF